MPIGWLVVAGVVLVAVVVCVVVALRRRRRRRIAERTSAALTAPVAEPAVPDEPAAATTDVDVPAAAEPAAEQAESEPVAAEPVAAEPVAAEPVAAEPVAVAAAVAQDAPPSTPVIAAVAPSVTTVGDLAALRGGRPVVTTAKRDPDTTPLPVSSDMLLQRAAARRASTSVRVRVPGRGAAAAVATDDPADETNVAAPWLRVDLTLADDVTPGPEAGPVMTTGDATASTGEEPGAGAPGAGLRLPEDEPQDVAAPQDAGPEPEAPTGTVLRAVPSPAPDPDGRAPVAAGAGHTLADAVAHALANRAAADRTRPAADTPEPDSAARDRLLAVLLEDPDRAVGATVELDRVRGQLDRLVEAVRHEQDALAGLVDRLASAGLDDEQIARLAGIPAREVATLRAADH